MARRVEVTCDNCNKNVKYVYYTVESHTVSERESEVPFGFQPIKGQATYCSLECLGYQMKFWADKYAGRLTHPDSRDTIEYVGPK